MPLVTNKYGNIRDFERAIARIAKRHKQSFIKKYQQKLKQLLNKLADATPVDTGAAAGDDSEKKRDIYRSHPAYGMTIGNEPGDSGWQLKTLGDENSKEVRIVIINPMWDHYLKFIEFGWANMRNHPKRGYIKRIWNEFREGLK